MSKTRAQCRSMPTRDDNVPAGRNDCCALCGQINYRVRLRCVVDYLTGEQFDIIRCQSCGLRVTRPFPDDAGIGRYYSERYRGNRHSVTGSLRTYLRARAVEKYFPPKFRGRLLDVGCGGGAFVLEMQRRGWAVSATEIDSVTVSMLRARGIDAKTPEEAERSGFDESFDVVTCWHVLEHVGSPVRVAQWVRSLLKMDGILQVTVPNAEGQQARMFGRHWFHLDVPRHRYHFTLPTLRALLTRSSFNLISSTCLALEYDWFGIIQSALNCACKQPNVLFDALIGSSPENNTMHGQQISVLALSYLLAVPLAILSFPLTVLAWALGDGATLTLTCKAQ